MLDVAAAPIDFHLDLEAEIRRLKAERNAVMLAHFYQESDIQDLADVLGDSLQLAQAAQKTTADVILFCGVHFMAETAKILNPRRVVIVPTLEAGCSLADGCPAPLFRAWRAKYSDAYAITYINCSAEVKAESDCICTSSNAEKIVRSVDPRREILFAPDKNLGRWLVEKTGRAMRLWQGSCIVHETFSLRKIIGLCERHPGAKLIAHPECEEPILRLSAFIGSTTQLLQYTQRDDAMAYIVATESGIVHQMRKASPQKTFIEGPPEENCACNACPFMRMNTLERTYLALRDLEPRIEMSESLRERAQRPIDRMLSLS
jgi:quinolinate synthase